MKTTLTLVLTTFGILALFMASPAMAQDSPRYAPYLTAQQSAVQASGNAAMSPVAQPEVVAAGPVTGGTAAAPLTPLSSVPPPEAFIDNGLWPGAGNEPGCTVCGGGSCAPPDWYVAQEVRILNRSRPRDLPVAFDYTTEGGIFEILNNRAATPNISGAWGMTIGHYFARDTKNRDHFVEFSFWGLNNWNDEAAAYGHRLTSEGILENTTFGSLNSVYSLVPYGSTLLGFVNADAFTIHYSSSTNNFELSGRITPRGRPDRQVFLPNGKVRRECQPGAFLSYLYGMRFFQLSENFRLHGESLIETVDPITGDVLTSNNYTGDYDIVTHNNLLGIQVGAELMFRQCRWAWGVQAKVGPYVNFSDLEANIHSDEADGAEYFRRVAASKHNGALIGEVGFEATYRFRPNLVGRAAYDMMWVSGVALAPEQLQFDLDPVNRLNLNGLAFFHGVTLGLEWQW